MLEAIQPWLGDLHRVLPAPYLGVLVSLAATFCGAAIGIERGKREKPAGLRSMMLICLGASVFTQAGFMLGGPGADASRVAANVVTGVGFLGAGAILHGRGQVVGFTTGAAIWAVAAIGVVVGAGYVVAGVFFTLIAVLTLTAEVHLDRVIYGACRYESLTIEFDAEAGKTAAIIQGILDDHGVPANVATLEHAVAESGALTVKCCRRHRSHRAFIAEIAAMPAVHSVRVEKAAVTSE